MKRFAPFARGSGRPLVIAGIELATPKYNDKVDKLLNLRIIIFKIVSSLIIVRDGSLKPANLRDNIYKLPGGRSKRFSSMTVK